MGPWQAELLSADAVVNLAGEPTLKDDGRRPESEFWSRAALLPRSLW